MAIIWEGKRGTENKRPGNGVSSWNITISQCWSLEMIPIVVIMHFL